MSGADPLVDRTIADRYRVEALLGRGGMCAVYRALDLKERQPVAIKVLPAESAAVAELSRRFQREVSTGQTLVHPNVVAVFDSGALDEGSRFLVMELVEGRSLEQVLGGGPLEPGRAVQILRQVLEGLGEAHRLGIAHRDVKPENVFLSGAPPTETAKLLDFGIASNDNAVDKLTATGVVFGTPEYISPEMALGLPTDARSDLYSAGVMLFQMVTGRLPFSAPDPRALLHAHARTPAPSARSVAPQLAIPVALDQAIDRALRKLPEERFPTAAAMIAALSDSSAAPQLAAPLPRSSALRIATPLAVLVLAALALGWWLFLREPAPTAKPSPPKRGQHRGR